MDEYRPASLNPAMACNLYLGAMAPQNAPSTFLIVQLRYQRLLERSLDLLIGRYGFMLTQTDWSTTAIPEGQSSAPQELFKLYQSAK